ncbi:RES family NAD+ phosphorylase [Sphingomonas sp. 2R-10]|uniref:RES family NAD+ phosphorylase n=1 Tax=Sphingomonas sp. 2R-10 TaxID=3045148 RepID=UPI0024BA8543|nr:RES family NAD+ phosphorylase [Sphingomonas sp. 2R-10]MDJ0275984.1 RES family NAD+ phosphorylase [Sphingomonas sp. 2R-10]
MSLDPAIIAQFTIRFEPIGYIRATPWDHRATPLGMGYGNTRFASPTNDFTLLYIAVDLPTSIAEAIVRDRFEGHVARELMRSELADWGVCEVSAKTPLAVLDLRGDACFELGVSTDIVGAKGQDEARTFSQALYDGTDLDGILYRSRLRKRHDCVAVYDRAVSSGLDATPVEPLETLAGTLPALRALKTALIA